VNAALYLGIDLGTSGVRGSAIDSNGKEVATASLPLQHNQQPSDWHHAAFDVIRRLGEQVGSGSIRSIAIDGTSGTVMLCDDSGAPCSPVLMYHDQSCTQQAEAISRQAHRPRRRAGGRSSPA